MERKKATRNVATIFFYLVICLFDEKKKKLLIRARHDLKTHAKRKTHWNNGVAQCICSKAYRTDGNWSKKSLWIVEMIHLINEQNWQHFTNDFAWITICHKNQQRIAKYTCPNRRFQRSWCWARVRTECVSLFSRFIYHIFLTLCEHRAWASLMIDACAVLWKDGMIHFMSCTF